MIVMFNITVLMLRLKHGGGGGGRKTITQGVKLMDVYEQAKSTNEQSPG